MSNAPVTPERTRTTAIPAFGPWLALSLLLAVAIAVVLALLLTREPDTIVRDGPVPPPAPPTAEMLAELERIEAEQAEITDELRATLEAVVAYECPPGTAPEDVALFEEKKQIARRMLSRIAMAGPATTPVQARQAPESAAGPDRRLGIAQLSGLLEKAAAFVIAGRGGRAVSTGTAFFVAPDLLVTNRHVVGQADPGMILITSESLGRIHRARLTAISPEGRPGEPDFALLRLDSASAPAVLPLASDHAKLMDVVVAGYPGLALAGDAGFMKLAAGDMTAAPDMHQNRGQVRSTQELGGATTIIHTADVLTGYSGGPLVDLCGRVIGVNTFIKVDMTQSGKFNSAQSAIDLAAFLREHGAPPAMRTGACSN